jgi:hypothetical protein
MKKLNQVQKELVAKAFPKMTNLMIKYVEKIGNEKTDLQDDLQLAFDFIKERE